MPTPPPHAYRPGDIVAARWQGGQYYIARILAPENNGFSVVYGDGDEACLPPQDLVPIPTAPAFAPGDHVLACWKDARMFTGVIQQILPTGYLVAWDDGDPPLPVPKGRLTYAKWAALPPAIRVPPVVAQPAPSRPAAPELAIFLPGEIYPEERGEKYADPLMDFLDAHSLGKVVEEGTSLTEINGKKAIQGAHIYVQLAPNIPPKQTAEKLLALLKQLHAPTGTTITDDTGQKWSLP